MAAAGAAAAVARIEPAAASGALVPQVQVVDGQIVVAQRSLEVQAQPQATFRRVVEDTQVCATHQPYPTLLSNLASI